MIPVNGTCVLTHCTLYTQSYTMRNGVLGVIGEVVGQVLNSSEMDEQAKCTRDQLLDKLEVRGCECVSVGGEGGDTSIGSCNI